MFNRANFFEAHEVWEQAWKRAEQEEKIFYQGLIQAAAALHHIQRGNYRGAISVYLKCRPKLDQFPEVWMGIEVGLLRYELARYFAALRTASDARSRTCQLVGVEQVAIIGPPPGIRWAPA